MRIRLPVSLVSVCECAGCEWFVAEQQSKSNYKGYFNITVLRANIGGVCAGVVNVS